MKTKTPEGTRRTWLLHPFLLAVYPILFLYSQNMDEASLSDVIKPVALSLAATVVLLLLAQSLFRNKIKAAIVVTCALVLFFSYGHVFHSLRLVTIGGKSLARSVFLLPAWCVIYALILIIVRKTSKPLVTLNQFLNAVAVLLIALITVQVIAYDATVKGVDTRTASVDTLRPTKGAPLPDIYYIILDAYSRGDVLKDCYGYDNSKFLNHLRSRGFYVADRSEGNYRLTRLSLPSSLNFQYLDRLAKEAGARTVNGRVVYDLLARPRVVELLKATGYDYVFFPSGYGYALTEQPMADIVIKRGGGDLSEFDTVLVDSTMLRLVKNVEGLTRSGAEIHAENTLYALDQLQAIPNLKQPTFAFAHITITHPPFVLDGNGKTRHDDRDTYSLGEAEYRKLYLDSVTFTNQRMETIVDHILARSATPPIIVIQADHGSRCGTRNSIVNAYYLPGGGDKLLYPSISPVNSFRVVFNRYFGAHYPLLDDATYSHVEHKDQYKFTLDFSSKAEARASK